MTLPKVLLTKTDVKNFYKSKFYGNMYVELHKNWFPIKATPVVSGIVSDLMSDGHLQEKRWRIDYCSKRKSELRRFENVIIDNFGLKGKIRECITNKYSKTYLLGINNKLFSRILYLIGTPRGSKTDKEYLIPRWILFNKECFRKFVSRYFSCEGTVSVEGTNSFIEISLAKSEKHMKNGFEFLDQMRKYLEKHFDIKTMNVFVTGENIRKDGTKTHMLKLRIKKLEDITKFYKEIGFEEYRKQNKLKKILRIKGQSGKGQ